ncbi:hypothetical protein SDC9_108702 [bioreactor metagenome]|uniref:Uncharacterized protein n=1 Tax=bioreactor metagenome TaxID=1076179 RepID=A0A645B8N4_9ZZZZ
MNVFTRIFVSEVPMTVSNEPKAINRIGTTTGRSESATGGSCVVLSGTDSSSVGINCSTGSLRVFHFTQKNAANAAGMANKVPNKIRWPILAFNIPAAARAPGWVGIRQCTE